MKKLYEVSQQQRNTSFQLNTYIESNSLKQYHTVNHQKVYYPYNYDINDSGWGCAWRALQTILSPNTPSFKDLFDKYSKYQQLMQILLKRYNTEQLLDKLQKRKIKWVPQLSQNGWAEPFIGRLVLDSYSIDNDLLLINGIPGTANAPYQVFDKTITFLEFKERIIKHFDSGKGAIMLDDGSFAYSIWGYKDQGFIQLLIADPHIRSNRNQKFTGIYRTKFDVEGNQTINTLSEVEKQAFCYPSYNCIHFKGKNWMVLFADK